MPIRNTPSASSRHLFHQELGSVSTNSSIGNARLRSSLCFDMFQTSGWSNGLVSVYRTVFSTACSRILSFVQGAGRKGRLATNTKEKETSAAHRLRAPGDKTKEQKGRSEHAAAPPDSSQHQDCPGPGMLFRYREQHSITFVSMEAEVEGPLRRSDCRGG